VAQEPPPKTGAADPLRDPGSVGQLRAEANPLDNNETIKGIERRLKCTCGCNLDIFTCRTTDFTCTYSPELHKEVIALFQAGQSADQIVAAFVAKHGEQILLAPPAQGFNILGYILPTVAVTLGAATMGFILLRRHRLRLAAQPAMPRGSAATSNLTPEQQAGLDRALKELDA
jgi:cytochrome c-type biogenesis protein CcmH